MYQSRLNRRISQKNNFLFEYINVHERKTKSRLNKVNKYRNNWCLKGQDGEKKKLLNKYESSFSNKFILENFRENKPLIRKQKSFERFPFLRKKNRAFVEVKEKNAVFPGKFGWQKKAKTLFFFQNKKKLKISFKKVNLPQNLTEKFFRNNVKWQGILKRNKKNN